MASAYSGTQALNTRLQAIMDEINGRYDTGITLSCSVTDSVQLAYNKGESVLSILKKLTAKYDFTIIDKVLYVGEFVGIDRTVSGANYFEFKRDYLEPNDRNVVDFAVIRNADERANAIQGKTAVFQEDAPSIAEYGRIEDTLTNSDRNEAVEIAEQLQTRKDGLIKVTIEPSVQDFAFADVGDILDVSLDAGNELGRYSDIAKVYEKRIEFGELVKIRVKLSETKPYTEDLLEVIRSTIGRVERLELQ